MSQASTETVSVRSPLVGNRWMLAGGLLYLLEFVGIMSAGMDQILVSGRSADEVMATYAGNAGEVGFLAGWMAVVLLGRVLVFAALRSALARSGYAHPLLDWAVVAAAVSVTLEVASHGMAVAAARQAEAGDADAVLVMDQLGAAVGFGVYAGLAVAMLASTWCMWHSRLFAKPLLGIGAVAGIGLLVAQLTAGPATEDISEQLTLSVLLFWVWMLWAGVVLWRRTPKTTATEPGTVAAVAPPKAVVD
jgi:hypothetical protein